MIIEDGLQGDALRAAVHLGAVVRHAPSEGSRKLVEAAKGALQAAFEPCGGLQSAEAISNEAFLEAMTRARTALRGEAVLRLAVEMVESVGLPRAQQRFDHVRLRGVRPGAHREPAARHAFSFHRDTWFANPRAQLNWWIPLHDVSAEQTFEFVPEAFGMPVENDSHLFDFETWTQRVGFQNARAPADAPYPSWPVDGSARRVGFAAREGEVIVFSAAHLHGTRGHDGPRCRFSLDFRTVDSRDLAADLGAPDPDNASTGSAVEEYVSGASL